jgi:hypothetical protein
MPDSQGTFAWQKGGRFQTDPPRFLETRWSFKKETQTEGRLKKSPFRKAGF